jgi:hypothetical protein
VFQNSSQVQWTLHTLWCKLLKIITKTADKKSTISHVKKKVKKWARDNLLQENEKEYLNQVLGDISDSDPNNNSDLSISG